MPLILDSYSIRQQFENQYSSILFVCIYYAISMSTLSD